MKIFTKKIRKLLLILCICGMALGFASLIFFQRILPDSYVYNAQFEVNVDIEDVSKDITVDSVIYEPKHGTLDNPTSNERPLVVLIHGFAMSKEFMLSMAIELALRGVTSISISMPGHGLTDPPFYYTNASPYCVMGAIDFMISGNPQLNYPINESSIGVIGHSMGAMTAIKAGFLDSRINTTIAVAPPSGTTSLVLSDNSYGVSLGGDMRDWVDLTMPRNLLLVLGQLDEAVRDADAQAIMTNATGLTEVTPGTFYGDFNDGTARQYNSYSWMDHILECFDPRSVSDMMNWIADSFELDGSVFNGNLGVAPAYIRPILVVIGIVCSFLLIMPLSSYLSEKYFPGAKKSVESSLRNETDLTKKKIDWKKICKIYGSFFVFVGIIPTLIGQIVPINWAYGGTVIAEGSVPTIFIAGLFGILWILLNSKFKFLEVNMESIWKMPQTTDHVSKIKQKYILYFAISVLIPIVLVVFLWSSALFYISVAPYRIVPFILTILMLIPLNVSVSILLRRTIYPILRCNWAKWKTRIVLPIINNAVVGLSLGLVLALTVGTPLFGGFLFGYIFWILIIFGVLCLADFPIAGWSYYMEGSIYIQILAPAILFAIILNVFPIGA
jgi:pimeloyl-ACP methyl ester carboxylesterase